MRRLRSRLLLSTAGLLTASAILEGGLRLAGFQPDVPRMEPNPYFGWRNIPHNTWWYDGGVNVHANAHGLRDREFEYDKPEGASRVFVLGDSMAEGGQVPEKETFPKKLEQLLRRSGAQVDVINGGIAGFGTAHELLFYEHEAAKYRPDVVVLAFFMGNDVYDNSQRLVPMGTPGKPPAPYFVLVNGELRLENFPCRCETDSPHGALAGVRLFLRRYSATYGQIGPLLVRHAPGAAEALARQNVMGSLSRQTSWMTYDDIPLLFFNFAAHPSSEWTEAWAVTRQLLVRLRDDVARDGARLIVAGIPAREQVHRQLWDAALSTYPKLRAGTWDLEKPDRLLAEASAIAGVPYLSLLRPLRDESHRTTKLLFFDRTDEAHLNSWGHAAVAAGLRDVVTRALGATRQ